MAVVVVFPWCVMVPRIMRSTIDLDKANLKANIQAPKTPSYKTQAKLKLNPI
jgi:hypothetical protein